MRDGAKITQSCERLAVGERCSAAEENRWRQSTGTKREIKTERIAIETIRLVDSFL